MCGVCCIRLLSSLISASCLAQFFSSRSHSARSDAWSSFAFLSSSAISRSSSSFFRISARCTSRSASQSNLSCCSASLFFFRSSHSFLQRSSSALRFRSSFSRTSIFISRIFFSCSTLRSSFSLSRSRSPTSSLSRSTSLTFCAAFARSPSNHFTLSRPPSFSSCTSLSSCLSWANSPTNTASFLSLSFLSSLNSLISFFMIEASCSKRSFASAAPFNPSNLSRSSRTLSNDTWITSSSSSIRLASDWVFFSLSSTVRRRPSKCWICTDFISFSFAAPASSHSTMFFSFRSDERADSRSSNSCCRRLIRSRCCRIEESSRLIESSSSATFLFRFSRLDSSSSWIPSILAFSASCSWVSVESVVSLLFF
ncbi:hypothetical protein BLNAU_19378 [Blattamonas nauphoetae]|uniref:Uncharacterized protein n=1 Tax=Blattamonas nauphoetae TaxID=2049346 RepID=A0ABQ9X1S8_9EUKA|nr:hypothetical protein BLNAU_19378 [Blattamonas nauphoetae]